jgi:site-specific DNA recombinase
MKKAFSYYRKSIEREADKSIEGQKEEVRRYAAENNIEIIAEFEEVASSATLKRKEFQKIFQLLSTRDDIDYIIVYMFDRATREADHIGWIFSHLKEILGVKTRLHSATEDNDYEDDPTKLLMIMMKTYGTTQERINSVKRMQEGKKRKQQKGGFLGGTPPVGYKSSAGKLVIEESGVPIVETVFSLREKGESMEKIAAELNKKGFKTRKNRFFHAQTVQRILKYKDWYEGHGEAPAILGLFS